MLMTITCLIRNECYLLHARGFWTSDDIVNDGCDSTDIIKVERLSEESSNNVELGHWSGKGTSSRGVDNKVENQDIQKTKQINRIPQGYKQRKQDSIVKVSSGGRNADVCANENNISQLFEPPVKDIYLYTNSDDCSLSSFGSLISQLLPKVVSRKLPILKGFLNDENVVTLLHQADPTNLRKGYLCAHKDQDNIRTNKRSMNVLERISQGYKQLKQDLFGNWLSNLWNNHTYHEPVKDIYLNSASDDSSVLTFDSLGYQSLPKISHRKDLIIRGSWNEEKIITVLCSDLSP